MRTFIFFIFHYVFRLLQSPPWRVKEIKGNLPEWCRARRQKLDLQVYSPPEPFHIQLPTRQLHSTLDLTSVCFFIAETIGGGPQIKILTSFAGEGHHSLTIASVINPTPPVHPSTSFSTTKCSLNFSGYCFAKSSKSSLNRIS